MAIINGTPDDDGLIGTAGDDTINGFAGNDVIRARAGNDTLDGGDDHDFLVGGDGNDILIGGNGDDYLRGGEGDDIIDGGAGFDRAAFTVGVNNPAIGETGVQTGATVDLNIQGVAQNTGHGMDTLIGIENVSGTTFNDTLVGNGSNNWIWGEGGNDILQGGGGNDLVETDTGNSTLDGGSGIDTAAFVGSDTFTSGVTVSLAAQGSAQTVAAGSSMTLTNFENLSGSLHDDTLSGDGGDNVIAGNTGNDTLYGGAGSDILYGDGSIAVDTHGLGYSGQVVTTADVVTLDPTAVDGNDTLDGGAGDDIMNGGGGNDTASFASWTEGVTAGLGSTGNGFATNEAGTENDTLISIENLSGSAYNDILLGNNSDNVLTGGDGDDQLYGHGGNDTMIGGNGNDFLRGYEGDDIFDGGAGNDRASFFLPVPPALGVHVDLNIQGVAQDTGEGMDTLIGIENVSGTIYDDTLIGNSGDNWIWDGSDGDPAVASSGNDTIMAGAGNDVVEVGNGNDTLDGGTGIDTWSLLGGQTEITSAGVTVSLALQGAAQDTEQGMMTATGFENLSGSIYADNLTGDGGNNVIAGDLGNDNLAGGAGDDTLYGDGRIQVDFHGGGGSGPIATFADVTTLDPTLIDGNDTLDGGAGNDIMNGGGGIDTASFASWTVGVIAGLNSSGNGFATNADGTENDTLISIENLSGTGFDDQLNGNLNANTLTGGNGDDSLRGNAGNDTLLGGNGNDFLNGGLGDDTINGGAGYDRATYYTGATAGVTVDLNLQGVAQNTGSQGMDTLTGIEDLSGTAFGDTLTGDNGDNWLWGSPATLGDGSISAANNDTLSGGGGNDLLTVGIGNHSLTGGTGTDTVAFTENGNPEPGINVSLALQGGAQATGAGSWTLNGIENLSGGVGNDHLTGDGGNNVLAGDGGNDTLVGGAGDDTLYGDGRITADSRPTGSAGPITTFADVTTFDPSIADGNDTLDGGAGNDIMNGGGGIDTASFASWTVGVTVGLGTSGNGFATNDDGTETDTLISIENVTGSSFNDFISGSNGANVLNGGDGGDALFGRGGDDQLIGGNGNDFLRGSDGADILDGGAGFDRVSSFVPSPTSGITFNLNIQGVAQDTGQGMDTLISIENASGTILSDTLIGDNGSNWLWGGSDGVGGLGTGNDTISGNGGNDLIEVGTGNHTLSGGTGTDTLSFLGGHVDITSAGVTYSLALQGAAAQATEQGSMITSGFENVSGSLFDDIFTGDSGNNILLGDFGNDSLSGGSGNDTLYGDGRIWVDGSNSAGGSGPVTLFGEADDGLGAAAGNDTLNGGNGNDTLFGGRGNDTLIGGAGDDRFVIQASSGNDHITDFSNHDSIVFEASSGVHSFSDLTLTKVGNNTVISWGTSDSLTVDGVKPNQLHASDFQFVTAAASAAATNQVVSQEPLPGTGYDHNAVADALSLGSNFHSAFSTGGDGIDHGMATLAMQAHI